MLSDRCYKMSQTALPLIGNAKENRMKGKRKRVRKRFKFVRNLFGKSKISVKCCTHLNSVIEVINISFGTRFHDIADSSEVQS